MNETLEFKTLLNSELSKRIQKNPSYSLRAFAKDLDINDSTLSKYISGKRKISPQKIIALGKKLGLNDKSLTEIASNGNNLLNKNEINLSVEKFNLMSEWYFDAIIEIIKTDSSMDLKSIAKKLKITQVQTNSAVKQLIDLKVISQTENGFICHQEKSLMAFHDNKFTSEALKNYQEQILNLSKRALKNDPRKKRNHTSHIIAVSNEILPEIIKKIQKFQHELADYIEEHEAPKDDVMAMQFTLFKLTNQGDIK